MQTDVDPLLSEIRQKGHRVTRARRAILEVLAAQPHPVDASSIQQAVERTNNAVNKTTIYRELEFLGNANFVVSIEFGDGRKRFELVSGHHHHTVCVRCGDVADVVLRSDLTQEEKYITRQTKFYILRHSLEFFGVCRQCQPAST